MMKTFRKLVAMVLLLLIHLLTLQIGDAERNHTSVSSAKSDPKIILEEVIIAGSGNNTRVIANAVAKDASELDGGVLSLLSKREIPGSERAKETSDLDQDAAQSRAAFVNANDEDNLEDLEIMSRVIAKYEPQRLTSQRKTKRKIVDGSNDTRDKVYVKDAEPITEFEEAYAEVLRNISQKPSKLTANNADLTLNPYLSLATKQLKQVYIPEVTIRPATNDGAEKSHSDVDSSFASPTLNSKKSKRLPQKYLQLNRTVTTPRFSSVEESISDEESTGSKSSTPAGYFKVSNGKTKAKNGSLSVPTSNIYSGSTEKPKSHREWSVQDSSNQVVPSFTLRLNSSNSNNIINANNFKNFNVPSDASAAQSPPRYNIVPRPFSILQSPNSLVTANINASYRKPNYLPAGFSRQQQITRSSANVLPLVLPTDLFNPLPTRRYTPIKRAKHLNLEGNSAAIVSTEANLPTSPVGERSTLADYDAFHTAAIGSTKNPLVTVNSQQSHGSSDYYAITESPTERTVTKTNFATTYIPSQTSVSYGAQRQKDAQTVHKNDFLPKIATYNSPDDEKPSLNENPGIALYNQFANLYSANVPNAFNTPKAITQDFKQPVQPSQQQVSTLPYATLKPLTPTLLKVRPIASSKPAPYYDKLLVSQDAKHKKNSDENVETNEQSLVEDTDEADKEEDDDNDDVGNYKTQVNREAYKVYKTPSKQRKKEEEEEEEEEEEVEDEENRYPQQNRSYEYQDKHYEYDENDRGSKNKGRREKYENARRENNDDEEEEADKTEEEENISTGKNKDEDYDDRRHQYNKHDRDNSDEEQREKPRYDHKKYNKPKDRRDKHDYDVENRFVGKNKYFESLYEDEARKRDKEYRPDKKKLASDHQNKKSRPDRKYKESTEESVAEDKLFAQRFKDQRAHGQDERYEEEQNNDDDKRIYHRVQASPRRDSPRQEHTREEYSETNPTHAREEYHQQRAKDDHRDHHDHHGHDGGDQDNGKEEARDHVHGETQEHAHKHEKHHDKKKGGGDHKFEEGGGSEHEEEHHGHEGEKGDKGYKVWHEHEKAKKGHHDREHASKHYDEKGGEEKKHDEEGGYHEEHHHGEAGKKTAEFGEKGEHKKGHSTHGEHSVHKKDEFEKKTEFFDEFHEDGGSEKHGDHHHGHESKKGGHEKKGHHDSADHEEKHGKEEKHEKGGHHHEHKGHKVDEGHDHHYDHHQKHGKKEGHEHGKKWSFKKGDGGGDGHKHNR